MAMWTDVPLIAQKLPNTCWEAVGRMVFLWRYKTDRGYDLALRDCGYNKVQVGLTQDQLDIFYRSLGMRSLANPKGANLRFALNWSPVIFTKDFHYAGHAMVLTGFDGVTYFVNDPCMQMTTDKYYASTCTAGPEQKAVNEVEDSYLGQFIWYW